MKIMNFTQFGKRALALSLLVMIVSASSMVTLATSTKPVGELIVSGGKSDAVVTVNGEPATSGRTVFASSTITTPEGVKAVLNLGKAGRIELSPNTTFVVDGDGNIVSGSLTSGNITVLNAAEPISVKTLAGDSLSVSAGESVDAVTGASAQQTKTAGKVVLPIIGAVSIWALVIAGGVIAATTAVIIADNNDNGNNSGGSISPVR